jgi:Fe-S oxidoreductase
LHDVYDIPLMNLVQSNYVTKGFSDPGLCFTCGRCEANCPIDKKIIPLVQKQRERLRGRRVRPVKDGVTLLEPAHKGIFNKLAKMEAKLDKKKDLPKKKAKYGFYPGCADLLPLMNINVDHVGIKPGSMKLLKAAGIDAVPVDMSCCGHDQLWQGRTQTFETLRDKNEEFLRESGIEVLITSCAECYRTLSKNYDLGGIKVQHISQALEDAGLEFTTPEAKAEGKRPTVIFHDACRLGRHMKVYNPPRNLVNSVPGIEVKEFEENREQSLCCGVPNMVNCTPQNRYYRQVRLTEAVDKKADYLVTTCPKCVSHYGCMRDEDPEKYNLEVMDLTVFLSKQLKVAEAAEGEKIVVKGTEVSKESRKVPSGKKKVTPVPGTDLAKSGRKVGTVKEGGN